MGVAIYQLGAFRLDRARFELLRNDHAVKLERKPLELLVLLVENRDRLVTRKDIAQRLWGSGVFVDTELGINTAIRKLRQALGDDTDAPRYIQTVPGLGYRFIASVDLLNLEQAVAPVSEPYLSTSPGPIREISSLDTDVQSPRPANAQQIQDSRTKSRSIWLISGAVIIAVSLFADKWYTANQGHHPAVVDYTPITHTFGRKNLIGTDGARIYFNHWISGVNQIGQVSVAGGETSAVPAAIASPVLLDVTREGSSLLVASANGSKWSLWDLQNPSGQLRRLADSELVNPTNRFAWSPDGMSIAYVTQRNDIYLMRADGSEPHRILPGEVNRNSNDVVWSPDGKRIRFTRDHRFWEVSSDGSGLHALMPESQSPALQCCGRWTDDGRFFVFVERADISPDPDLAVGQLWILDERSILFGKNNERLTRLTTGPIQWATPIPSRDGKAIFARGVSMRGELVRYELKAKEFLPALGSISAESVAYSRDGKFVAYVTFPQGVLWMANADGSGRKQLTSRPIYPLNPHWSPDGTEIVFWDISQTSPGRAYLVSAQGGPPRPLLGNDPGDQEDASWSPSGKQLVYSSGGEDRSKNEIRILDRVTGRATKIPGSDGVWSPRWSPDGRYIVALTSAYDLTRFDVKTKRWSLLQAGPCGYPNWSSDSQFVYYLSGGQKQGIYRVRSSGGPAKFLFDLDQFHSAGVFGVWLGLDFEDNPILLRDAGTDEIYKLSFAAN